MNTDGGNYTTGPYDTILPPPASDPYNSYVQARAANGHAVIRPYGAGFRAIGSTASVDARDNTCSTGTGVPIHWLSGSKVADDYGDFYDGTAGTTKGTVDTRTAH